MKNQIAKSLLLGILSFGLAVLPLKAATYINGDLSFTGGITLNGPIGSATAITSFFGVLGPGVGGPLVNFGPTGDYVGVPAGKAADFSVFTFNPEPVTPFQLWTFSVGAVTYSFDVTSVVLSFQDSHFLNLQGTGIATITGGGTDFLPTAGTWSITDTGTGNSPVFTFGNITAVPEPSSAALMAGLGSILFFAVRRFKVRA